MSAAALPSDIFHPAAEPIAPRIAPIRVSGGVKVTFVAGSHGTHADDVHEADGYRVRFPRGGIGTEAVLLNTGGGVAGGDQVHFEVTAEAHSSATVTTQAAERIYRALGRDAARIGIRLNVAQQAHLAWIPQETILYSGARLERSIEADVAPEGRLILTELMVFGRKAMGETVLSGALLDHWRIRRGGRLVYADSIKLDGSIAALMSRPAVAYGASIIGTVLMIAPDAEDRLEAVRANLGGEPVRIAASAWNGLLAVRCLGHECEDVRRAIARVVPVLTGLRMPRVWAT
jgi:urease accessory protein